MNAFLPLFKIQITLTALSSITFRTPHHNIILDAFLRSLLSQEQKKQYATTLIISPQTPIQAITYGNAYTFNITAINNALLLSRLLFQLKSLPFSARIRDTTVPLRHNLKFHQTTCMHTGHKANSIKDLTPIQAIDLENRALELASHSQLPITLNLARLKKSHLKKTSNTEQNFAQNSTELTAELLLERINTTISHLHRALNINATPQPPLPTATTTTQYCKWINLPYFDKNKQEKTCGGLNAQLTLRPQNWSLDHYRQLALIEHVGIGQRRTSGFGTLTINA